MRFPPTERAAAGVSMGEMFRELLQSAVPGAVLSMFLTAASELAPGQWVDFALSRTVHMPGILLLVYVSALMFVMRHFAGPLVHKLSSIGLLWVSCLMAIARSGRAERRELADHGSAGRDHVGHGRLLHVADDARDGVGAVSARRRAADGADGHGRDVVDSLRAADHGVHLRSKKIEVAGGEAAFNALPAGPGTGAHARHRGADVVSSRRGAARDPADCVRWNLAV